MLIGSVEGFFSKINVVAIKLSGDLKVGDLIEIGDEESSVKQRISSMQIDRHDVQSASAGDSVGIKLNYKVSEGSSVYRV
ncbi:MAG: translation elongation factor-like protein [Candidatus Micrarchaeota archaeon]|nr:translation elongation factor-like protein [Candidatus Micrarchaeota archaeon]